MIDGAIRAAVEEAIRFLRPGGTHLVAVNDHEICVVALEAKSPRRYAVGCLTCSYFISDNTDRAFMAIHNHTKDERSQVPNG